MFYDCVATTFSHSLAWLFNTGLTVNNTVVFFYFLISLLEYFIYKWSWHCYSWYWFPDNHNSHISQCYLWCVKAHWICDLWFPLMSHNCSFLILCFPCLYKSGLCACIMCRYLDMSYHWITQTSKSSALESQEVNPPSMNVTGYFKFIMTVLVLVTHIFKRNMWFYVFLESLQCLVELAKFVLQIYQWPNICFIIQ